MWRDARFNGIVEEVQEAAIRCDAEARMPLFYSVPGAPANREVFFRRC
jgi:hypothetical protein